MAFEGNPYATITAVDATAGILMPRTSGDTPMFVQVSAGSVTLTGTRSNGVTAIPFEDLEYTWDFGDSAGTETITNPVTGLALNPNTAQTGPEAVYVYRSAGSFTITLSVRGKNGGAFSTTQTTQVVTVSAFNPSGGDYYFDSVGGSDANPGTIGSPKQTLTGGSGLNSLVAANTRFNLKRGSDFSGNMLITANNLRVNAYSTGAKPIVRTTSGIGGSIKINGGNGTDISNIVCSDVEIINNVASGLGIEWVANNSATGFVTYCYADNCSVQMSGDASGAAFFQEVPDAGVTGGQSYCGFYKTDLVIPSTGTGSGTVAFVTMQAGLFIIGGSLVGKLSNAGGSHLIYPSVKTHQLYRWVTFTGLNGGFCVNGNWNLPAAGTDIVEFWLFDGCLCTGSSGMLYAWDMSSGPHGPGAILVRKIVTQNCAFTGLAGFGATQTGEATSVTYRNNNYWNVMAGGPAISVNTPSTTALAFYGNKIYNPSSSSGSGAINVSDAANLVKSILAGNIIQDMRSTSLVTNFNTWTSALNGSYVDLNQYYTPNDATCFGEADTGKSLAAWQTATFDPTILTTNPNWLDPANGNFATSGSVLSTLLALRLRLHG